MAHTTLGKGLNIHLHSTPEYSPKLNESAFHESQQNFLTSIFMVALVIVAPD